MLLVVAEMEVEELVQLQVVGLQVVGLQVVGLQVVGEHSVEVALAAERNLVGFARWQSLVAVEQDFAASVGVWVVGLLIGQQRHSADWY